MLHLEVLIYRYIKYLLGIDGMTLSSGGRGGLISKLSKSRNEYWDLIPLRSKGGREVVKGSYI